MKIKLTSSGKLQLVKAVKDMLGCGLKEAKDLVDEQEKVFGCPPNAKHCVIIDSEMTEEQTKAIAQECEVVCTPLSDIDICERKLQEVTIDDLGVSIHSIDEETIGWQCKMLFTHEQTVRILSALHDAKLNVTETLVMHKGNKTTMLVIAKNFPSGVKRDDLGAFECLIHRLVENLCRVIETEHMLKDLQENVAETFEELDEYE